MNNGQDPVTPHVTFDNYVLPETVTTAAYPRGLAAQRGLQIRGLAISGTVVATSVIAVLTFLLGVMATLEFTEPRQNIAQVAEPVQSAPVLALPAVADAETVTRAKAPDLISTPQIAQQSQVPILEAAVLAGLQPTRTVGKLTQEEMVVKAVEAQDIVNRNKLRMLREGVLAGVYTVRASTEGGNRRLVLTTVNAEMTRQAMGHLLLKAAKEGKIVIPPSLSTAEGDVDMDTMLFNLIQNSLATDGTVAGQEAAKEMSRRAFAASEAKTQEVRGERIYVVERGDSLAYLALQFYGRPNAYPRIFEANREKLSSPDLIKIGQRLKIPG